MITNLYTILLYQPLFNILVFLYDIIPGNDVGVAIVLLTVLVKVVLNPFSKKSLKSQKRLQEIQPRVDEIRKKYKDDKERQAKELMTLYKEENINPFSSCLPLLIQLPFIFAVYRVFQNGLTSSKSLELVYPFLERPESINPVSLGLFDLSQPNIPLAVLAGLSQYWQTKMLMHKRQPRVEGSEDENMASAMNRQMMYVMPVLTVVIGFSLPGGLMLYWFVTSVLTAVQQYFLFRKKEDNPTQGA